MNRAFRKYLFLILFLSPSAFAQTFTVGVENIDYYPMYSYEKGQYKGVASEILTKFAATKGYTFEFKPFPVVRLTKYFVDGEVDFKFPDNSNWAQDAKKGLKVQYSHPVLDYIDGTMVVPANAGKGIGSFSKLGIVRGFTAWDYLSLIKTGSVKVKEATNLESLIQQAIHSRVDGVYFNVAVAKHHLAENLKTPGALVFDDSLPHTNGSYSLSSHKHPKVVEEFNQFLIDEAGWIEDIKKKYGAQ